jgi:hypothetical protein
MQPEEKMWKWVPDACEGRFGLEWNLSDDIDPGATYGDLFVLIP